MPTYLEEFAFFKDSLVIKTSQEALLGQRTPEDLAKEWADYLTKAQQKFLAAQSTKPSPGRLGDGSRRLRARGGELPQRVRHGRRGRDGSRSRTPLTARPPPRAARLAVRSSRISIPRRR